MIFNTYLAKYISNHAKIKGGKGHGRMAHYLDYRTGTGGNFHEQNIHAKISKCLTQMEILQ